MDGHLLLKGVSKRLLLELILQNMVRHFVIGTNRYKQIHDTLFRQRITAGSGTDL